MIGITATGALHTPVGTSSKPLRTTDTIAARPGTGDMNFKKSTNGKIVCVENTATTAGEIETGMIGAITAGHMTIALVMTTARAMTTAIAATTAMITDACCHRQAAFFFHAYCPFATGSLRMLQATETAKSLEAIVGEK